MIAEAHRRARRLPATFGPISEQIAPRCLVRVLEAVTVLLDGVLVCLLVRRLLAPHGALAAALALLAVAFAARRRMAVAFQILVDLLYGKRRASLVALLPHRQLAAEGAGIAILFG